MDLVRANAANLVELKPDVIVAVGGRVIPVLLQLTRTIPIVVPGSADPVGTGYVKSLARPAGNITGFALMDARRHAAGRCCVAAWVTLAISPGVPSETPTTARLIRK